MKIKFDLILKYLRKYKFILLFSFILIVVVLFNFTTFREGLSSDDNNIGEYDFLAPPTAATIQSITQETWDSLANYLNAKSNLKPGDPNYLPVPFSDQLKNAYGAGWGLDTFQINYYIKNGEWPWDGYVTKYLNQNPNAYSTANVMIYGVKPNASNAQQLMSNRTAFLNLIWPQTQNENPLPLAGQIFTGKVPPPPPPPPPKPKPSFLKTVEKDIDSLV
jgi:hypothetical protein